MDAWNNIFVNRFTPLNQVGDFENSVPATNSICVFTKRLFK